MLFHTDNELMKLIVTFQPVVKLLINRHNNKYSYTTASDDNLLKNIELFDKSSLRFSGRVLFIKDVIGSSEICCWTFYGHGKKVAEICCTSIVYTTDRKHTKVIKKHYFYKLHNVRLGFTSFIIFISAIREHDKLFLLVFGVNLLFPSYHTDPQVIAYVYIQLFNIYIIYYIIFFLFEYVYIIFICNRLIQFMH